MDSMLIGFSAVSSSWILQELDTAFVAFEVSVLSLGDKIKSQPIEIQERVSFEVLRQCLGNGLGAYYPRSHMFKF